MSYTAHNFTSGHKLRASELNAMDGQIAAQEAALEAIQATLDAQGDLIDGKMLGLEIETDAGNAVLVYNNEALAEIELPADLSSLVECTSLEYEGQDPLTMTTDATATISPVVQPSNCNQNPLYYTSNPNKLTVTSAGVVTALEACRERVHILCAGKRLQIPVVASAVYHPTGVIKRQAYYSSQYSQMEIADADSSQARVLFTVSDQMIVPPGYTATITNSSNLMKIMCLGYLWPGSGWFNVAANGTITNVEACVLDPKSMGSAEAGGNGSTYSDFDYAEGGTPFTNETYNACYIVMDVELYEEDPDTHARTARLATSADIASVKSAIHIKITPPAQSE